MAKYNIGGYIFNDENSAKRAAKELKAVEYILGQIKAADEQQVLKIYKKIINQKLFSTEIGLSFLQQLRQNLVGTGDFDEADIPPVYTVEEREKALDSAKQEKQEKLEPQKEETPEPQSEETTDIKNKILSKSKKKKADNTNATLAENEIGIIKKLRLVNSFLIVCVFTLLLCVLGMFYVSTTINSPTILNYKEVLTDEYSSWKQELDERERQLNEREAELDAREAEVSEINSN